ncbi:hypothetical protein ASG67_17495 [Sphingomonas sp. Leaf339]|nr:hypothetical protein ASG67_17495 [Sphingomonas sp. Leaf339]
MANLPLAALQRTAFTGAEGGHLVNLPLASLQGAAIDGVALTSKPTLRTAAKILRIPMLLQ